jgi:hypothetical protein
MTSDFESSHIFLNKEFSRTNSLSRGSGDQARAKKLLVEWSFANTILDIVVRL